HGPRACKVRDRADVRDGGAVSGPAARRGERSQDDRGDLRAMKRIAFARIAQESNALSPVTTELADFEDAHYLEGDALLRAATEGPEVAGFFKRAELAGFVRAARARAADVEPVPILSAWASSGGPLSASCFEVLEARLVEGLRRAGSLDGMYL